MARLLAAVLMAAALLMLLIACANAANLLLALATQRRQEALIKTALGASRLRLVREFLRETVVLCSFGGVLGYAMALAPLAWLSRFDAPLPVIGAVQIAADLHPGTLVAALTLALIVLASAVSGLAPALYASKPNLASALSGEMAIGGTRRGMLRNAVVVVQVAICTLVLVGTGLCLRGLHNLRQVDPGFSAKKIVMIFPDIEGLPKEQGSRLQDQLRRRVQEIGGVESVSLVRSLPLGGMGGNDFAHEEIRFTDRAASAQKTFVYSTVVRRKLFRDAGYPAAGRPPVPFLRCGKKSRSGRHQSLAGGAVVASSRPGREDDPDRRWKPARYYRGCSCRRQVWRSGRAAATVHVPRAEPAI